MKQKNAITLLIVLLLTTTLGYAQADEPIRKYSYNTLVQLWKNLSKPKKSPKAAWYKQALLAHQIAESDSQQRAAIMIRHEIALNMYLNRAAYYEAAPEPKIGENETQWQEKILQHQQKITQRQNTLSLLRIKAHIELFLINLIRYHEASTTSAKCKYLTNATTSLKILRQGEGFSRSRLAKIAQQVREKYQAVLKNRSVCQNKHDSSERDISSAIEKQANTKIIQTLETQQKTVVEAIAAAQAPLKKMQDEANVPTKTGELLKLEMEMANARANLEFVHQDAIKLKKIIEEIAQIDFTITQIDEHFIPAPVRRVNEANRLLQEKILALMTTLEKNYEVAKIKACQNLSARFTGIFDLEAQNKVRIAKETAFGEFYQCLKASEQYIQKLDQPDPLEEKSVIFAKHLEQLSKAMLRRLSTTN
ncbi:MAG: hypothetical protein ABFS56_20635 [Pseudomonadota bacterium]